ncbi:MAG: glycosyltransferase family 4 protein [Acidobacteriota bacterium]
MRIAVDARALLGQKTGIGTYTRGVAAELARRGDTAVGLFLPRPLPEGVDGLGPATVHADRHRFGTLWLQTTLPRRIEAWRADALLAALTIAPLRGSVPVVSVVHDLTPWTHPEWHADRTLAAFVPLWERTIERAARLLCVSQATADDLERLYPETRARVRVVWNGVDAEFTPSTDAAARARTRARYAGGRPFLLYLGTLEPRKNVGALVAACERLWSARGGRPDLVLAGGPGWKSGPLERQIARSPFRDKIHLAGYATRPMALELYRSAEAFVYPSFAEGFGLPVVEAMACALPVVASDAAALTEVGGEAALYAPASDSSALARQIERALEEPETRRRLETQGPARAALFSWKTTAEKTAAVLAEAAAE